MNDKHTPGPWVAKQGKYGWQIHSAPKEKGKPSHWIANLKCESCPAHEDANAHLIAAAPDLLSALEGIAQFFAMPQENSIDRFDRLAEQYRRETGKWAPGKSIPDAFNDAADCDTRRAEYDAWVQSKVDAARSAILKARGETA